MQESALVETGGKEDMVSTCHCPQVSTGQIRQKEDFPLVRSHVSFPRSLGSESSGDGDLGGFKESEHGFSLPHQSLPELGEDLMGSVGGLGNQCRSGLASEGLGFLVACEDNVAKLLEEFATAKQKKDDLQQQFEAARTVLTFTIYITGLLR